MKVAVIIPARMAASRFPGKPLALIKGLSMIEHVRRRAMLAKNVTEVIVATCDEEIKEHVEANGGKVIMTSDKHERCTDRVAEAAKQLDADVVVNVQGDEPLLDPSCIELCIEPFLKDPSTPVVSMLSPLESQADFTNSNIVKASCNQKGEVMYFSRTNSLYYRKLEQTPIFRETGIRAMGHEFLLEYSKMEQSPFERVESVDMFRVLEYGHRIQGVIYEEATYGVDHVEDVDLIEDLIEKSDREKEIFGKITA